MAFVASECAKCGAPIEIDESKKYSTCDYCGAKFLAEEALSRKKGLGESAATVIAPVVDKVKQVINSTVGNTNKEPPVERPKMSGCVIAVLIVCFWPAAIIYYIVKSSAQKEWDTKNKK